MKLMTRCTIVLSLTAGILLFASPALAQTPEELRLEAERAAREAEQQRRADQALREERERSIRMLREFLGDSDSRRPVPIGMDKEVQLGLEYSKFRQAASAFATATSDLETALGFKTALKKPAESLYGSSEALLGFVKKANRQRAGFNSTELKDYKTVELAWEALTVAERIMPDIKGILRRESTMSVDLQELEMYSRLEGELLRLRWIVQRLK